jgi:hypothetical protein
MAGRTSSSSGPRGPQPRRDRFDDLDLSGPPDFSKLAPAKTAPGGPKSGSGTRKLLVRAGWALLALLAAAAVVLSSPALSAVFGLHAGEYIDKTAGAARRQAFANLGPDVRPEDSPRLAAAFDTLVADAKGKHPSILGFRRSEHYNLFRELDRLAGQGLTLSESELWIFKVERLTGRNFPRDGEQTTPVSGDDGGPAEGGSSGGGGAGGTPKKRPGEKEKDSGAGWRPPIGPKVDIEPSGPEETGPSPSPTEPDRDRDIEIDPEPSSLPGFPNRP